MTVELRRLRDDDAEASAWTRVEGTLMTTARAVRRVYDRALADAGLNLSEASLLGVLANEGAMTQTQLAVRIGTGRARIGVHIDSLEAKVAVRREADPSDRRVWLVSLTESGRELWERSVQIDRAVRARIRAGTTAQQRRDLEATLQLLAANCSEQADGESPDAAPVLSRES